MVLQGVVIFLFGVISATFQKFRKTDLNFPYVFIVAGFVLGYIIAIGGHRFLMFFLFILGLIAGLSLKKIIRKQLGKTRK